MSVLKYADGTGAFIRLDDVRVVFVGSHPSIPDRRLIALRNAQGEDKTFALSHEAAEALAALFRGEAGEPGSMPAYERKGWKHAGPIMMWTYEQ